MPVKLALIRQKYVHYGGAESFAAQYTTHLAEAGHEVHIFANQWKPCAHPNLHVHPVAAIRTNSFLRTLTFARNAARAVRRQRFDAVQSHERTWCQDIYRAGDGCHREWLEQRKRGLGLGKRLSLECSPFHRLILVLERRLFEGPGCKKIVAISHRVKRDIQKHYRVPDEKIAVVYNGVQLDLFHPKNKSIFRTSLRKRLGIPDDAVLMLFVGSGFERKGLEFLLRSLAFLNQENWRLLLVGKGEWNRYLNFAPEKFKEKIHIQDPVDTIEQFYGAADVFVLPSIYEPFGNANLEALASGLPIVTSAHCGAAEIIGEEREGFVIQDPRDAEEIASHLNRLFDVSLRERMGRSARLLAEQFTQKRCADAMLALYREVAAMKSPD